MFHTLIRQYFCFASLHEPVNLQDSEPAVFLRTKMRGVLPSMEVEECFKVIITPARLDLDP